MNPSQSPPPSPEVWFSQLDQPPLQPPPSKPPRPARRRILLIIFTTLLLLVVGLAMFIFIRATCFNPERYTSLVNTIQTTNGGEISVADVVAGEPLYYHEIRFTEDTVDISTVQTDDPLPFLKKLGEQYQSTKEEAPFTIRLETQYLSTDSLDIAQRRLEKVKSILTRAGVNVSAIIIDAPTVAAQDADSLVSDDAIDGFPVNLSITPIAPDNCTL